MLAVLNGIKSMLRKPWKAALFMLILAVIAALLSVSLSVFLAVRGYLDGCEEYFRTIVVAEYMGENYPAADHYDADMAAEVERNIDELNALISAPGVRSFTPETNSLAFASGTHRADKFIHDPDAAVLQVYISNEYEEMHSAIIERELYSRRRVEGKMLLVRTSPEELGEELMPEVGGRYYITGRFFTGINSYLWFKPEAMISAFEEGEDVLPQICRVESADAALYEALAETVSRQNDSIPLTATSDISDFKAFHQAEIQLTEGRLFEEAEYESGAKVCILTELSAAVLGVGVGDTVELSVFHADGDIYAKLSGELPKSESYLVVGICSYSESVHHRVFIPVPERQDAEFAPVTGYTLGSFSIENRSAESFFAATEGLREKGFKFTVYDQGYAAATAPLRELYVISIVFLGISLLLALAALLLQSYIFITRQREPAKVMLSLGSGKPHIFAYFISAAVLTALPGALLGCAAGKLLESRVFSVLSDFTEKYSKADLRYSNSSFVLRKTLEFSPRSRALAYAAAAAILILGCCALTVLFTAAACRDPGEENRPSRSKKQKKARRVRGSTSAISGKLKYAFVSMRRNGVKSAVAVLLALVAAVFFGRLTDSLGGYSAQLEAYRNDSVIRGYATDPSGEKIDGLVVKSAKVYSLRESGLLDMNCASSPTGNLRFIGVSRTAEGEYREVETPRLPEGSFALETFIGNMSFEPKWIRTDSVKDNVLFFYGGEPELEYWEGITDEYFSAEGSSIAGVHTGEEQAFGVNIDIDPTDYDDPDPSSICAVSSRYMQKHGLKLGDTARFIYAGEKWGSPVIDTVDLIIGACYNSPIEEDIVFSPSCIEGVFAPSIGYAVKTAKGSWNSFVFSLEDNSKLNDLRDALEAAEFRYAGSEGRATDYAVILDDVYLNTTGSMERQIEYVRVLYNGLYALAMIIGFAAAWLLMSSRGKEIALMRALGTQGAVISANFILEQILLLAIGVAAGLGLHRLISGGFTKTQLVLTAIFSACWLAGCITGLAPKLFGRTLDNLADPE